jgi:glyoxylase-like metal-dependent hydrolase (beta-lactamase superfamily II)/ferredoxin
LPENAAGRFFVDSTCIDCDLCRQIAPAVFARADAREQSIVTRQPADLGERRRAAMAAVACPTSSIGGSTKADLADPAAGFPEPLEGAEGRISFVGFAHESSFGAASYLVHRPDGNVLVDSPRAARPLLSRLQALGGVRLLFLTHRDDVADHEKLHRHLGCTRVLHEADRTRDTAGIETVLSGSDPTALGEGLLAIPVPGHTAGSTALLVDETFLFTGDHLWWNEDLGRLSASRSVCWFDWREQVRSIARLRDFRFEWVIPGHGRRFRAPSAAAMKGELERLLLAIR